MDYLDAYLNALAATLGLPALTLDAQGRIRVKDELLEYAGIVNQMVLIGTGIRFELWSPESWQEQSSQLDQSKFAEAAQYIGF